MGNDTTVTSSAGEGRLLLRQVKKQRSFYRYATRVGSDYENQRGYCLLFAYSASL